MGRMGVAAADVALRMRQVDEDGTKRRDVYVFHIGIILLLENYY